MKLGITVPYGHGVISRGELLEFVRAADALGYDAAWVPEPWGLDAFMALSSLAEVTENIKLGTSVVNVFSRTPALIGQATVTLDALSHRRAVLGVGASGPQVIEGWHGLPYHRPVQRTRETVEIVRRILRREKLTYDGDIFQLNLGLKIINRPVRPSVPIHVAAIGRRNVELAAEVADGWIPAFFSPDHAEELYGEALRAGASRRNPNLAPLLTTPSICLAIGHRPTGTTSWASTSPFTSAEWDRASTISTTSCHAGTDGLTQPRRYSDSIAAARIPHDLLDQVTVLSTKEHARDRFAAFSAAGCDALQIDIVAPSHRERMRMLEEAISMT